MYSPGYNRLFWGMMFLIFNINLGLINILPDFIGYIFIYSGLNILISQQETFGKGKIPALVLIIITLKDVFNINILNQITGLKFPVLLLGSAASVINLYLFFIIFSGIITLCRERSMIFTETAAKKIWNSFLTVTLIIIFYAPFSINMTQEIKILIIILTAVVYVIISLIAAVFFRRCRTELSE